MRAIYINPFFILVSGFVISLFFYSLGLSRLYYYDYSNLIPTLFLLIAVSLFLGCFVLTLMKKKNLGTVSKLSKSNFWLLLSALWLSLFAELIHFGGVPLFMALGGRSYSYKEFGIPVFHVLFLSYYSVFSILSFQRYVFDKGTYNLYGWLSGLAMSALIMNRGAFLAIGVASGLIYLYSSKHILRTLLLVATLAVALIVAFGYVGDRRMLSSGYSDIEAIYTVGQADRSVFTERVPSGFFWIYLYSSSPLANLIKQNAIGNSYKGNSRELIKQGLLPDFLSKRLSMDRSLMVDLITPELTVSTAFGKAYVIMGSLGIVTVFTYYLIYVLFFLMLNLKNNLLTVSAVLSSVSLLMLFDNMVVFSSFFFQLVFISLLGRLVFKSFRFI